MQSNQQPKDWIGNTQAVMATLNASSHSKSDRETNDYYATPPSAVQKLLLKESFDLNILEPACGQGHISEVLKVFGHEVISSDLIDRGYGTQGDFLSDTVSSWEGDIITNPPFAMALDFVKKSPSIIGDKQKIAFLLRIQFLEGVERNTFFQKFPPKKVYVFSRNIRCAKNGDFESATGNASTYCWFVWEKGFTGSPTIDWII